MAILLAALASVFIGSGEHVASGAARRIRPEEIVAGFFVTGLVLTPVLLVLVPGRLDSGDLGLGAVAGVGNALGLLALYRGYSVASVGVVAPVAGVLMAALPAVIDIVAGDGVPSGLTVAGLVVGVLALALTTFSPGLGGQVGKGVVFAILAGLAYGVTLAAIGSTDESSGMWPVVPQRAIALVVALAVARATGPRMLAPPGQRGPGYVSGVFGTAGVACFVAAAQRGSLGPVSVAGSHDLEPGGDVPQTAGRSRSADRTPDTGPGGQHGLTSSVRVAAGSARLPTANPWQRTNSVGVVTDLATALARHPRLTLTRLPTPIQPLRALSERLGLDVWIKRDDLTDLALGGDKARKLEFELAVARAAGTDTLVTCGSSQSNHARLTTAAARQLGMACTVVLSDDEWRAVQGNLLTVHLMGADVVMVETEDHWDLEDRAHEICAEIERRGGRAHYIPVSGTTPTSCLGYVAAGLEISEQITELGLAPDAVFTPFGTGGVFTALMLAFRHAGLDCPMVGVSVNRDTETCRANIDHWWSALHDLLEIGTDADRGPHEVTDEFLGAEYGDPTPACLDAIVAFAETEGVLLDPVYTGKMGAGFLDRASRGRLPPGSTVLLVHTGGVPALFAYHRVIEDHLRRRGGA